MSKLVAIIGFAMATAASAMFPSAEAVAQTRGAPKTNVPAKSYNPCCPPWNPQTLAESLFYKGTSIGQPYTLEWVIQPAHVTNLKNYLAYVHGLTGGQISKLIIEMQLYQHGPNWSGAGTAIGPNAAFTISAPGQTTANTYNLSSTNWAQTSNIFAGNATPNGAPNFTMQVNQYYRIHTGIYTHGGEFFSKRECGDNDLQVAILANQRIGKPGNGYTFQARDSKGKVLFEKPVESMPTRSQ